MIIEIFLNQEQFQEAAKIFIYLYADSLNVQSQIGSNVFTHRDKEFLLIQQKFSNELLNLHTINEISENTKEFNFS